MVNSRGSGILMHISSLPGPYGIGDLGKSSLDFIKFLAATGQRYWQILPVGPSSGVFAYSPYMSLSAFAGNPLLINPEMLAELGVLHGEHLTDKPNFSEYYVEYDKVVSYKTNLLEQAYKTFLGRNFGDEFTLFCKSNKWLDDYALFMSLREENSLAPWNRWPKKIAGRKPKALSEARKRLADRIGFYQFEQFCFFNQWENMRQFAAEHGITLFGDMPIYVGFDSADVWAHQSCFSIDPETLELITVAGVPPDYFSETGQRWGNPLYRWKTPQGEINDELVAWWMERFRHAMTMMDLIRIDHFRGFASYWEIPALEETAVKGRWVTGPGKEFFDILFAKMGDLPIVAEDLGIITDDVIELRDSCGFPGMKILQFAFDSDEWNLYLPHNFASTNCIVYTGTHDNDTTVGWYFSSKVSEFSKKRALRYSNSHGGNQIHWDFIRMALASTARIAIIPLQDVLGFGGDCRMNQPGTVQGNWSWRCAPRFLNESVQGRLRDETKFYGRNLQEVSG
ncbi:MAG: 4-alpha-glucanotransferase [Deltaproteobacteria bacterium RIFOXYD12_FULL_50_9]|nr:MAG: 4-alpha-glucanotransferase [Deltaproteobacteria bacterium RIFOXYD12_FULL_50_9]